MKIAIISDIHDNLVNLKTCLDWCGQNKIEAMICCGDVTGAETLEFLTDIFKGKVYLVDGNADFYVETELKSFKNLEYFGKLGWVELEGKKIGFCHEKYLVAKVLEKGKCDYVFYGHSHKPFIEDENGVEIVNPGALCGGGYKACFATLDLESGKLDLKILELF